MALFDRAAARDLADVFELARRWSTARLYDPGASVDAGLDRHVLAEMIGMLDRYRDGDLPVPAEQVPELRRFFGEWAEGLRR